MKKIKDYLSKWKKQGYENGIPDEVPSILQQYNLAPSYKAICFAILKNDLAFISLGYSKPYSEIYNSIKKAEIENRKNNHEA